MMNIEELLACCEPQTSQITDEQVREEEMSFINLASHKYTPFSCMQESDNDADLPSKIPKDAST